MKPGGKTLLRRLPWRISSYGMITVSQYVLLGPNGPPHCGVSANWLTWPKSLTLSGKSTP